MSVEEIIEAALKLDPKTRWRVVENEIQNKTAILGGNVSFVTNYSMKVTGVAYLCGGAALLPANHQ